MRLPGLPVEGPPSHVPTCLHSFITVNSRPTRPGRAPFPPASVDPISRQPGLRHDPASVDPQHLPLGRNTGPAWPGVIPAPSEFDPLRFHHLLLHGRPHGRYCGRRSQVHHKDAEAATHSTGQSALRSPHLLGPLRSIHQHRLLPGSYPGTAGPLHLLSVGTPARPVRACSPLPARILHGRRRHSNCTTTMAGPTKRPAVCPSWPELVIGLVITWTVAANPTPTPALVSPMASHWRLSRPGQPRRQPDASRSRVLAVSSLYWARAH